MNLIEVLFLGFTGVGSGLSLLLWIWVAIAFRTARPQQNLIHAAVVYLAILSFLIFDILILSGLLRIITGDWFRYIFSFGLGVQVIDAIAALILVNRVNKARLKK